MDMPLVVQRSIEKAVQLLNAAGCTYAIRQPDDAVIGTPEAFIPKPNTAAGGRHRVKRFQFHKLGYQPIIDAMQPGDVRTFESPSPELTTRYRQALGTYAGSVLGNGGYITAIKGTTVEILCTARKEPTP